jgi:hypothetical protein
MGKEETVLCKLAAAFERLAAVVSSGTAMEVRPFADACAQVLVLFGLFDNFIQIASRDYESKARGLSFNSLHYICIY